MAYSTRTRSGKLRCDVCPQRCVLSDGERGVCFVRQRIGDEIVSTTYGRAAGFAVDPIEKKPLYHFLPGTTAFSFGTAGCNLACRFCQNWHLSHARSVDDTAATVSPSDVVDAAVRHNCASVAFTYNDPVVFLEYAIDTAAVCRERGLSPVAVTAGFIHGNARADFFTAMDAANIDLKAFTDEFYRAYCNARLAPVLETLKYVQHETSCRLEITTLLIPGLNDGPDELTAMAAWVHRELGADTPWHFSAFHPSGELMHVPRTPVHTLLKARKIARAAGMRYVYIGNARVDDGGTTFCPSCAHPVVTRESYVAGDFRLDASGRCAACGTPIPGVWTRPHEA
ncbi:MAG: AmmeMemoRadiSam system radical SAM enzyme [Spirochaetaceae bacterium]|nr:MAG: AmmeMemoRadiSam system radical SAM enzyme [Spirochaetaceae bacterium]